MYSPGQVSVFRQNIRPGAIDFLKQRRREQFIKIAPFRNIKKEKVPLSMLKRRTRLLG